MNQLIKTGSANHSIKGERLATGVKTLPDFAKDATDRNRTSPFAFTGNKFEFRMVGAKDSGGEPNTVLNTIVAEAFCEACDYIEAAEDKDVAIHDLIEKYFMEHERIVFDGNGYSEEWVKEAARRGLPNLQTMVDAIPALTTEKAVALFEKFGVFTRAELESRAEIQYETYAKVINIEAQSMIDIASKELIPAVIKYTKQLAETVIAVKACGIDASVQEEILRKVTNYLTAARDALVKLKELDMQGRKLERGEKQAQFFKSQVVPAMEALRKPIDKLEMIVEKDIWPMPSYGDLIFEV